jgi:hypothetical protein
MTEETNNIGVFKAPSDIHFMGYEKTTNSLMLRSSVELMRMSRDGIWVNPDIPVDEAAKQVLEILDNALKNMVRIAVEENAVKEWKGLSTAEVKVLWNLTKKPSEFAKMIETKLKEKNHGCQDD